MSSLSESHHKRFDALSLRLGNLFLAAIAGEQPKKDFFIDRRRPSTEEQEQRPCSSSVRGCPESPIF